MKRQSKPIKLFGRMRQRITDSTGIYQIKNLITGHTYIGSAAYSFSNRWRLHLHQFRNNKHKNPKLQSAWNKYGEENFIFGILAYCKSEECLRYEQLYIDSHNPEYNLSRIAGSPLGCKWSEEARKKLSERQAGRKLSAETKAKIGMKSKGRYYSPETRAKMSSSMKGRVISEAHKAAISIANTGRKISEETREKLRTPKRKNKVQNETINP